MFFGKEGNFEYYLYGLDATAYKASCSTQVFNGNVEDNSRLLRIMLDETHRPPQIPEQTSAELSFGLLSHINNFPGSIGQLSFTFAPLTTYITVLDKKHRIADTDVKGTG